MMKTHSETLIYRVATALLFICWRHQLQDPKNTFSRFWKSGSSKQGGYFERVGAARKEGEHGRSRNKDTKHSLARCPCPHWGLPYTGMCACSHKSNLFAIFFILALPWLFLLVWQHDDLSHILHEVSFVINRQHYSMMHSKLLTPVIRDRRRLQNGWIFGKVPKGGGIIFNPKIYIADFGPLNRAFSAWKLYKRVFLGYVFNQLPCWTVVLHASHGK